MVATPVSIGPLTGGLNNYSDVSAVGDTEAVRIENFDVDLDGTLVSRPAILYRETTGSIGTITGFLGIFTYTDGVSYIINRTGTGVQAINLNTFVRTNITTSNDMNAAVFYKNNVWLIPASSGSSGGEWNPSNGFTVRADIPVGVSAVVYKERLFVGDSQGRIRFSAPGMFDTWGSSDFIDARVGDGQNLVKLLSHSGQVVIFKTESTHIFSYDSDPARASIQEVSSTIGVDNTNCVVEHDGVIYVFHNQTIYTINNWRWEQVNVKVVFQGLNDGLPAAVSSPYSLSILGYRLMVRYGAKFYVYGLKTRAWSVWTTTHFPDFWIKNPEKDSSGLDSYYAGSYNYDVPRRLYVFQDRYDYLPSGNLEQFTCVAESKMYDYAVPYSFKRIFYWGINLITKTSLDVTLIPQVHAVAPTWGQVTDLGLRWGYMTENERTWARPLDINLNISDTADITYAAGARVFVRFIKSLRFRQISYRVQSVVNGSSATSPLRIFSMVAHISNRQSVPKKLN